MEPDTIQCRVCGKPVDLRFSKTDEDGKAVHEECYVANLENEIPKKASNARGSGMIQRGLGVPFWMKNSLLHAGQVRRATRIFGISENMTTLVPQYGQTIGC
jgi:hypothetical protein